jgi:hypothetical protein
VSIVKYELGFCIPEDGILPSDRRENLKCCILLFLASPEKHTGAPSEGVLFPFW